MDWQVLTLCSQFSSVHSFFFFANDLAVHYANQYYQKLVTKSSENICTRIITIIDAAVAGLSKNNTIIKDV